MRRGARNLHFVALAPAALVVAGPVAAHAAIYLSVEEAGAAIFPGRPLATLLATLSPEEAERIEERAGMQVRSREIRGLRTAQDARLYVDRVLGKHEEIVYAVGIEADGRIAGVEILEYRETYGGEIRQAEWRAQFRGRRAGDPLALGAEIHNLSGATLSCRHVTDGVRRILATDALLREREAAVRP